MKWTATNFIIEGHMRPQVVHRCFRPVVPKVWVATQTRVAKGHKMGHAKAIQTWVVYFHRYHCLSLSVCSVGTRNE